LDRIKRHGELLDYLREITEFKDKRYGNSVNKTFNEYGPVAYFVRLDDKLNRAKQILLNGCEDTHEGEPEDLVESVFDTLMDLANYTLLFVTDLEQQREDTQAKRTQESDKECPSQA
jgi:hypothetical protein